MAEASPKRSYADVQGADRAFGGVSLRADIPSHPKGMHVHHAQSVARIVIDLLPDGRARIVGTCLGRPDASYAPLPDGRLPGEVGGLVAELRERLAGKGDAQ